MAAQPQPLLPSIRSVIARELQQVAIEHGRTLAPLSDEMRLLESGLDSLGVAMSLRGSRMRSGLDPLPPAGPHESPVTLGDFVRMYERVLLGRA